MSAHPTPVAQAAIPDPGDRRPGVLPRAGLRYIVFAQAKSGTTWVQRFLSAHPQVHCAESRPLGDFLNAANPTGSHVSLEKYLDGMLRHYNVPTPCAASPFTQAQFGRLMLFNLIDAIAQTTITFSGKPIYGEKLTPFPRTASACIATLREYNPALCYIHLVRDGRDAIVSGFAHWSNIRIAAAKASGHHDDAARLQAALDEHRVADAIVEQVTATWVENIAAGLDGERAFQNSLRIRYEDLIAAPLLHFTRLCTAIGADAAAPVVHAAIQAASFENLSGGRAPGEEDRASFFRKGVAGDWQNWLTPEQSGRFEERAGSLMEILGYARGRIGAAPVPEHRLRRVHTPPRQSDVAGAGPRGA